MDDYDDALIDMTNVNHDMKKEDEQEQKAHIVNIKKQKLNKKIKRLEEEQRKLKDIAKKIMIAGLVIATISTASLVDKYVQNRAKENMPLYDSYIEMMDELGIKEVSEDTWKQYIAVYGEKYGDYKLSVAKQEEPTAEGFQEYLSTLEDTSEKVSGRGM